MFHKHPYLWISRDGLSGCFSIKTIIYGFCNFLFQEGVILADSYLELLLVIIIY